MAKRQKITFETRVPQVIARLEEKPQFALHEIGRMMVPEVRAAAPKGTSGRLKKSVGYWYRKREKDLQVGAKIFYAAPVEKRFRAFLLDTFKNRLVVIQQILTKAIADLGR
jgi:hypothetical protein